MRKSRTGPQCKLASGSVSWDKATISDPYRCVFRRKWCSFRRFFTFSIRQRCQRHVATQVYRPKFYVPRTESYLFLVTCFPTLLNWNTRELKSLLIIRAPPELLLSEAPKLISRLWPWTFLISFLLTASFWKRNGSQGRLLKGQIFSADLLTKMTGPSTLLYFEWFTPNGALIQSIDLRRITRPRFLDSILNLPPSAAAALTPWPRIGETRTIGSALLWVPSSLLLELSL